jgi:hypothetical protein
VSVFRRVVGPGLCGLRTWVVFGSLAPIVVVLTLLASATDAAPKAPAGPRLGLDRVTGSQLPNNGGEAEVVVVCLVRQAVSAPCRGTIQLLARGKAARRLVGSAPVAGGSIKALAAGQSRRIRLRLRPGARRVLRTHVLALRLVAYQAGWPPVAKNVSAAIERPFLGHGLPNRVVVERPPRGDPQSGANYLKYSWKWDIPAHHYLELPDFKCPPDAPYVRNRRSTKPNAEADMNASATDGTGYGNFLTAHTVNREAAIDLRDHRRLKLRIMTGWPEGGFFRNSVWAPPFSGGHFELSVVCTNVDNGAEFGFAWVRDDPETTNAGLFPWGA